MNPQQMQAMFMEVAGQQIGNLTATMNPRQPVPEVAKLYLNLIQEEVDELFENFGNLLEASYEDTRGDAVVEIADDVADILVVLCGLCNSLGLPLEDLFKEVNQANMRKAVLQPDGSFAIIRREDGKILKPEGWEEPNINKILDLQLIHEARG